MNPLTFLPMALKLGPWVIGAIALAYLGLLQLDRNHLAQLNQVHTQCVAAVQGKAGSKPVASVCDAPIAADVVAATQAAACNDQLGRFPTGVPSVCSQSVQILATQRAAAEAEADNLRTQLANAAQDQAAAVARATVRATTNAQRSAHDADVLAAQPHDASGRTVCDAQCLRDLAGPPAAQ